MSMEVQEQSHGMDEDRQHAQYKMPRTLKKVEREMEKMPGSESLSYIQQMQKVSPVLRLENGSNDYDPRVVALGPYHHGKPKLKTAETFKSKALQHIIIDTGKSVQCFFDEVFVRVNDIRSFYAEDSTKNYSDSRFAQMMLLDACFIISYILAPTKPRFASTILSGDSVHLAPLGDSVHLDFAIIYRDMLLLENQIPLWFLKLVNHVAYGSEAVDLVDVFIYQFSDFPRNKRKEMASCNQDSHFLDACRRVLLSECDEFETTVSPCWTYISLMTRWIKKKYDDDCTGEQEKYDDDSTGDQQKYNDDSVREQLVTCFHSASDLKSKGIYFRPSRDSSLMGLHFKSGYYYGQLQLPSLHVSTHTKVFFSNLIAYESCLEAPTERKVTAYIEFMKSLIVHADDVKELRENGILFTSLGSDEEVVKMFKELNTSTLSTEKAFEDVRGEIKKHFRSKFKPRLGEFLYTYFRSPWTAIGTFAAIILLLLTLAQTYFTIWGS